MRATDRNVVAVMLSVALACMTLRPLTSDGSYLGLGWLLIGLIGGFTMAMRRVQIGESAAFLARRDDDGILLPAFEEEQRREGRSWPAKHPRTSGSDH